MLCNRGVYRTLRFEREDLLAAFVADVHFDVRDLQFLPFADVRHEVFLECVRRAFGAAGAGRFLGGFHSTQHR